MTKKIMGILTTLSMLLITTFLGSSLTSCEFYKADQQRSKDSIMTVSIVREIMNPQIESVDQALVIQSQKQTENDYNLIFRNMQPSTLRAVTSVLLNENHGATITQIVQEYLANQKVYDNLPDVNDDSKKLEKAAPGELTTPPAITDSATKDISI